MNKIILSIAVMLTLAMNVNATDVNTKGCVSCHGLSFEKSALNKSKIVADMNATSIEKSLVGYKVGTYGGSMKALMKGQVAKYSDEELAQMTKIILGIE